MHREVVELRRYTLHPGRRDELIELFDRELVESQEALDIAIVGSFVTDTTENTFPRPPVRGDDTVLVWFAVHPGGAAGPADVAPQARRVAAALGELQVGEPETLRLAPTTRSRLDGAA